MDVKGFLAPTGYKLVLAALLFFVFVPFIVYDNGIRCFMAPCPASDTGSILLFLLSRNQHVYNFHLPELAAGLLLAYLAACSIVVLSPKVKR